MQMQAERLAAAGRYGRGEYAGWLFRLGEARLEYAGALAIDRAIGFSSRRDVPFAMLSMRSANRDCISSSVMKPARAFALPGDMNSSVSRKSASTRQENNRRTHSANRPGMFSFDRLEWRQCSEVESLA